MRAMIDDRQPLGILVGANGSGKSTIAATLADRSDEFNPAIVIPVSPGTAFGVMLDLLLEMNASQKFTGFPDALPNLDQVASQLQAELERRRQAGQHIVAFVDAADGLPDQELSRLLTYIGAGPISESRSLTSFLIGSTELLVRAARLTPVGMSPAPQVVLGSLVQPETFSYIRHRLQRAGGNPEIFSDAAIELIHDLSGGVPRRINRLCDLCLLVGFHKELNAVTQWVVWTAQGEVGTLAGTRTAVYAPTRRWRPLGPRLARICQ
jgi:type II secretory pathway predicted ATPase ExeA